MNLAMQSSTESEYIPAIVREGPINRRERRVQTSHSSYVVTNLLNVKARSTPTTSQYGNFFAISTILSNEVRSRGKLAIKLEANQIPLPLLIGEQKFSKSIWMIDSEIDIPQVKNSRAFFFVLSRSSLKNLLYRTRIYFTPSSHLIDCMLQIYNRSVLVIHRYARETHIHHT